MMRFYSLPSPLFKLNKQNIKSITPQINFKQRAIYNGTRLIRTLIVHGKCFVTISEGLRVRQSEIIVEGITITNLHVTNKLVILIGEQQFVGWMSLQDLLDKFNNYRLNKIILTTQQFHKLSFYSHHISIIQSKNDFLFIFFKHRTISILKYNEAMIKVFQSQVLLQTPSSQILRSIIVDSHYNYNQNVLFIVNSNKNIFVCQLNKLNQASFQIIVQKQGDQQQIELGILKDSMITLLCNSFIYLIENEGGKWHVLAQIVPQATVISLHAYSNSILTHQHCDNSYNVFRYCVEDICCFTKVAPYVLSSHQQYYPLCLVKAKQVSIWLRGDQSFLLMKPIYQLTTILNGSYQRINLQILKDNVLNDQLHTISRIQSFCSSNCQVLSSLGINNKWSFLQQIVSQYLSIFICLTAYLNPYILLPQKLILPFHLERVINETNLICSSKLYHQSSTQTFSFRVGLISKKAYIMSVICKLVCSQKQNILNELSLNQVLCMLYDTKSLIQFLLVGLRKNYKNNNKGLYLKYRQLLTSITKYQNNHHPPLLYLLTNRPFQFTCLKESLNNKQIDDDQNEVQNYMHKYHGQSQSFSQDLLLNSISKFKSSVQQQQGNSINDEQMNEDYAFRMVCSMQESDYIRLSDLDLGPLYNYSCRLKLLNTRVIKMILLQQQEWQFRSSYNQSVSQNNSKNLNEQAYKEMKKKLAVQEPNLIDRLIQSYLLNLEQLSSHFNLKFTGKLREKKKQIQFDNLLKDKKIHLSVIKNDQESLHYKQFQISCCPQQQPFKNYLSQALWNMYLSLTNIQQYHFEVYQQLRDNHFIQCLIDNYHSNHYSVNKLIKIKKKDGRSFLQKLNQERKKVRISERQMEEERKIHFWMKLIELCYYHNGRWLGDLFDLLQQIIQRWYIYSNDECDQAMDSIYQLFFIEQIQ